MSLAQIQQFAFMYIYHGTSVIPHHTMSQALLFGRRKVTSWFVGTNKNEHAYRQCAGRDSCWRHVQVRFYVAAWLRRFVVRL